LVQSGCCSRFLPSVEMTGLAGDKGQKGENGSAIFSFLFFLLSMASSFRSRATRGKESGGLSRAVFH